MMRTVSILILLLIGFASACSPMFTTDFCKEIDFYNNMIVKYNKIEIEPNWIMFLDGYHSFDLIIRF